MNRLPLDPSAAKKQLLKQLTSQVVGILKAINHDQKEILARLRKLDPEESQEENKEE